MKRNNSNTETVKAGPGGDVRKYTPGQLITRTIDSAVKGNTSNVALLTGELAKRATGQP